MKPKVLKTVTDRFSLFEDGRNFAANRRNYVVRSVQNMIANPRTQELLKLREAFGYYGHGARERAKKLSIAETEVIKLNGQAVVVENVPSNRTVNITCSDDGIVEHTQEILNTPTGLIVDSLHESSAGGWSWATGGRDNRQLSIANSYHGMDYVLQPNYLSLDHPAMMLESIDQETALLESLQERGFDSDSATKIAQGFSHQGICVDRFAALETDVMYLESVNAELQDKLAARDTYGSMLLEAVQSLPVFMTDAQRDAMARMESEQDVATVQAFFESVARADLSSLPVNLAPEPKSAPVPHVKLKNNISFEQPARRFS